MTAARRLEPPRLYAIADLDALAGRSPVDAVEAMAQAGARWIQLRAKNRRDRDLLAWIEGCRHRIDGISVALWINDRADLALVTGSAGVHLGQEDLEPAVVRRLAGDRLWIGHSTHDLDQVRGAAADAAVDLVAVGPVFATLNKERPDPVVGIDLVSRARALVEKPLVAIGGIDADRAPAVLEAGADSVAVIGALLEGPSIERNVRRLLDAIG